MGVSPDDVRRIADLAALGLEPDRVDDLAQELSAILDHFDALRELDVDGVPPFRPAGETTPRPDAPGADPLARGPGDDAPGFQAGFFTVPRLASHVDEQSDAPPSSDAGPEGDAP